MGRETGRAGLIFSFFRVLPVDSFVTNGSALVNVVFCTIVLYCIY